jgi:hypothetical protein
LYYYGDRQFLSCRAANNEKSLLGLRKSSGLLTAYPSGHSLQKNKGLNLIEVKTLIF